MCNFALFPYFYCLCGFEGCFCMHFCSILFIYYQVFGIRKLTAFCCAETVRKMNIWMVWKPTKNAWLNWCACQFAYLNLIILTMPIKLSHHSNFPTIWLSDHSDLSAFPTIQMSNHSNWLSTYSTIPTFQWSNLSNCQTIPTFHPFLWRSSCTFIILGKSVFCSVRVSSNTPPVCPCCLVGVHGVSYKVSLTLS